MQPNKHGFTQPFVIATPQKVSQACPLWRNTVTDGRQGGVAPYAVWPLPCDANAKLSLLVARMMLEPLKSATLCAFTSIIVVTAERFAKAADIHQNVPSD